MFITDIFHIVLNLLDKYYLLVILTFTVNKTDVYYIGIFICLKNFVRCIIMNKCSPVILNISLNKKSKIMRSKNKTNEKNHTHTRIVFTCTCTYIYSIFRRQLSISLLSLIMKIIRRQ